MYLTLYVNIKNYWDVNHTSPVDHNIATQAAAAAPVRWLSLDDLVNCALQCLSSGADMLAWPPRQNNRRVYLVLLFLSTFCWSSESKHRPDARISTAFTCICTQSSNSCHCCCTRVVAVGPSTAWQWEVWGGLTQDCSFWWYYWISL